MSRSQRWWAAFAVTAAAVAISYALIDRPLAFFAHDHLRPHRIFVVLTYIPESFAAVSCWILVAAGVLHLSGVRLRRWQLVAVTWSVTVLATSAQVPSNGLGVRPDLDPELGTSRPGPRGS